MMISEQQIFVTNTGKIAQMVERVLVKHLREDFSLSRSDMFIFIVKLDIIFFIVMETNVIRFSLGH